MPEERPTQRIMSSKDITVSDMTILAVETRAWAGLLFRAISRKDQDVLIAYNNFVDQFYQTYLSLKYNAQESQKIDGWEKKEKMYDDLFYNTLLKGEYIPETMLKYFDMFMGDLVKSGIYNLTVGEFHGRHALD